MSTVAQIEAALPALSPDELGQVEAAVSRLRRDREGEGRLDGRPWPSSAQELAAMLAELDALRPLLSCEERQRFEAWRTDERERQRVLFRRSEERAHELFT